MKVSLVVLNPGARQGQVVTVKVLPFTIGRDADCQLRPTSPAIAARHCLLFERDGRYYVRGLDGGDGTLLNDRPVHGEAEIVGGDRLRIGPLHFSVSIEGAVPVDRRTPVPEPRGAEDAAEDDAAALLLSLPEDGQTPEGGGSFTGSKSGIGRRGRPRPVEDVPATPAPRELPFGSVGSAREILKQLKRTRPQ